MKTPDFFEHLPKHSPQYLAALFYWLQPIMLCFGELLRLDRRQTAQSGNDQPDLPEKPIIAKRRIPPSSYQEVI
ncbi:hypothetical protein KBB96_20005 [Luteolibacter ambystomatis]|uniref:Uncharacterized protein n=1 Tax=Luteolibacter ambystomatis TaxID=2824561 RepID=A0A975G983_9BACT|nr:hypothetical protein [Luteolibacter ambystomatis]QUE51126.1 hypothetical protein KBB96_20005 [Luteolibacter ambystomatis]